MKEIRGGGAGGGAASMRFGAGWILFFVAPGFGDVANEPCVIYYIVIYYYYVLIMLHYIIIFYYITISYYMSLLIDCWARKVL